MSIFIALYVLITQWLFYLPLLFINYVMLIPFNVDQYIKTIIPLSFLFMLICSTIGLIFTLMQIVSTQNLIIFWPPTPLSIAWTIRSFYLSFQKS